MSHHKYGKITTNIVESSHLYGCSLLYTIKRRIYNSYALAERSIFLKLIVQKSKIFLQLFGEQSLFTEDYKIASYCLILSCDEGILFYNNLTRELLLIEKDEYNLVDDLYTFDEYILDYLKKNWFLIPSGYFSNDYCEQLLKTLAAFKKPKTVDIYKYFTIMTTLECNARCFYCFQKDREKPRMTEKIAEDVADFIISHTNGNEQITLSWFGGEPLYNHRAIDVITDKLTQNKILYNSRVTTNGYLFNEELVYTAKSKWNLKTVQITLDGTEEIYNRSKNYIYNDCGSPFKKVIKNIKLLLDNELRVNVRLNLGSHNISDLYELADFLSKEFSIYSKFGVYVNRLFDYDDDGKQLYSEQNICSTVDAYNKFNSYLFEKGIYLKSSLKLPNEYNVHHCIADSNKSIVITPDGRLGKCEHFSDREIIGDIYVGVQDNALVSAWKEHQERSDICKDCPCYINCIRLKKCPDISPQCNIYYKDQEISKLKLKVYKTYNEWKNV